jgi:Fe-S cluster assembly protein SufD
MEEKPKVVVTSRSRRPDASVTHFGFTEDQVRTGGSLKEYRERAWKAYQRIAMPTPSDEAWRRTELRGFPADSFILPVLGAFEDLPPVREDLLRPLLSEQHGGQIVLTPGGVSVDLDEKLAKKGVIFTDLRTAEEKHPDLVASLVSKAVNPEEGKFAALTGALAQTGVVLYVPKGVQVEEPLHSVLWGPGNNLAHLSHILVLWTKAPR